MGTWPHDLEVPMTTQLLERLCKRKVVVYKIQTRALAIRGNNQKGDLEIIRMVALTFDL